MTQEYGADLRLPLLVAFGLLAAATCAFLFWGNRLSRRWQVLESRWPLWVLFATLVFLAANQLLVRGVGVGRWDADGQFFPYYVLVADHARAARLVQWDPWSNGGLPALADPQVGAFSPVNVLLGLVTGGTSAGFRTYWLLLWWLGGVGMLLLGRHLGAPPWGACAVALGFLFCGAYTGNAEHTSWIAAFSFLPVTVWRLDVALVERRLRPAVEAGALWGVSALGGYPGVVIVTGGFAALWAVGRVLAGEARRDGVTRPAFAVSSLAAMAVVGLLVLSPVYLAFFVEGAGANPRVAPLSRATALSNALDPGAIATFASPYLAALKVAAQFSPPGVGPGPLWPASDPSMVSIYAGALIPTLALFALLRRPRDRWRWWLAGLAGLSLACAVGETLPFRGWLYDWVYPTRFFRHAALFRLYYLFAVSTLALIATRDLADHLADVAGAARWRFLGSSLLVTLAAVVAVSPFVDSAWSVGMPREAVLLGRLHFVALWAGVCGLGLLTWRLSSRRGRAAVPALLVALATGDALLTSVLSIPTVLRVGADAARWKDLDARHSSSLDLTPGGLWREDTPCEAQPPSARCRRNDQLITKIPVFNSYATEKNPFHAAMVSHPMLRSMATGAERVWFSKEIARVPPTESAFAAFRARAEALGAPPLVIHSSGSDAGASAGAVERLPPARRVAARVLRYAPGELLLEVQAPADGWLLITDRWARSWRADVNGRRSAVEIGNFIFRALPVPAGRNTVRMTYTPAGFPWLVLLSWGTLALTAGLSVWSSGRRPPPDGHAGPHLPSTRLTSR